MTQRSFVKDSLAGITYPAKGPSASMIKGNPYVSGHMANQRMPQAHMGINIEVPGSLGRERKDATERRDSMSVLGSYSGNTEDLNIMPGEVVMARRGDYVTYYSAKAPGDNRPRGFTSFNGCEIPDEFTQAEFDIQYVPLGFAITTFSIDDMGQPKSGVPVRVGGAGSTIHNGSKPFMPMDYIYARIPSIDKEIRDADNKLRPTAYASPSTKQTVILEPYTYEKYSGYIQDAIDVYFSVDDESGDFAKIYQDRLYSRKVRTNLNLEICLGYVRWAVHNLLQSAALLENLGLMQFTEMTKQENWKNQARMITQYKEEIRSVGALDSLAVKELKYDALTKTTQFEDIAQDKLGERYEERRRALGFIASIFGGLMPDPHKPHLRYSKPAVDMLVTRIYHSALKSYAHIKSGSIMRYFGNNSIKRKTDQVEFSTDDQASTSILRLEKDAFTDFAYSQAQIRDIVHSYILGRGTNYCKNGEVLDYCIP